MSHFKHLSQLIKANLQIKSGTHLYLYRHGQSMANHTGSVIGWTDSKLSIKGRQQSNKMFRAFYSHIQNFTSIHTSDLARCKQSLVLSLGFPSRKIIQTPQLRQLNMGSEEGIHYDSMAQEEKHKMSSLEYKAPNGQSWLEARRRALQYLSALQPGHHLICTHGGILCAMTYNLGIKEVIQNCSLVAAELCPIKKELIKIDFQWRFKE